MGTVFYYPQGIVIHGQWPCRLISLPCKVDLTIADPPYGDIVDEAWDQTNGDTVSFVDRQIEQAYAVSCISKPGAALYWFGGYGKPNVRPWYTWVLRVERETEWRMAAHLTWSKKRAYGVQWNYLSTREEIAYCVKGDIREPRVFNVPLLAEKRGYDGYNKDYPAKSEFKRRTMVWSDITEILRGKVHPTQKPDELYKIIIETSSNPEDIVFDPFGGSGVTAVVARELGRYFIVVEREAEHIATIRQRLGEETRHETISD